MLGASILLTLTVAAQAVLASPIHARSAYAVKETHNAPRRWNQVRRAPKDAMLLLRIGVKQGNFDELERHLYEVSDPSHTRYGQHLSHEEVNDLIKPKDESLDLVHEWLLDNGIKALVYSPSKDWINIRVDVETAERLLDAEYYTFKHDDGTELIRAPEWSLPKHLHSHIDAIQPTTSFMRSVKKSEMAIAASDLPATDAAVAPVIPWPPPGYHAPYGAVAKVCTMDGTTPACFAELYGTKGYVQKADGKNNIGFNNFLGEVPIRPDTAQMLGRYRPDAVSGASKYQFVDINGGPSQDGPLTADQLANSIGIEANLDVQTIIGQTYPMHVTAFSTGGVPPQIGDVAAGSDPGNEPYLTWVNYVLSQKTLPQVISTSYGDDEQTVPLDYAKRVCAGFAQLGARGISIMFASGDGGVGDAAGNDPASCVLNDGKNTTRFLASFPPSCPYVTSVGATQDFQPEVAALRPANSTGPDGKLHGFYASGSGFSEYFPRPSYQDSVVPAYVAALKGEHKGLFNPNGRAYPDIAAQGLYFQIVWNATFSVISGTSASTPLMSSIIALVNDALISKGKAPLGFLNPWLYAKGYKGFTDITAGGSAGCGTNGFPVTKGWDAVTGFGTPVFPEIVKLAGCA